MSATVPRSRGRFWCDIELLWQAFDLVGIEYAVRAHVWDFHIFALVIFTLNRAVFDNGI